MTQPDESPDHEAQTPPSSFLTELRAQLRPLLLSVPLLTLLTGVLFPLVLAALACPVFQHHAGGSLVVQDGKVIGSDLIGQKFTGDGYFHSRPSKAGDNGYDPLASGGSNLGPTNQALRDDVENRAKKYREINDLAPDTPVPIDAVTSSGSGLDPHISPDNADLQVARVARKRHLNAEAVRQLVAEHTHGRQFWFLGEPRVNVLALNLALDQRATVPR